MNIVRLQRRHQPVISGKVITPRLFFSCIPYEIHAHPTKARFRKHLDLAGPRIGEIYIDTKTVGNYRGRGSGLRNIRAVFYGNAA